MRFFTLVAAAGLVFGACPAPDRGVIGLHDVPALPPPSPQAHALCALPDSAPPPYIGQPAGFHTIDDRQWSLIDGLGWTLMWGHGVVVTDTTAPFEPPLAAEIDFPVGFVGGSAAGTLTYDFGSRRAVYASIWWKLSDPWQGHPSNSNKVAYLFTESRGSMAMIMYGTPGGPYELRVYPDWQGDWLRPNATHRAITLGAWHHIAWLVQYGATANPPSGVVRWWLDGALIGNYCDVKLPSAPLTELKLAPVWGGIEAVRKTEADFVRYGPIHISGR